MINYIYPIETVCAIKNCIEKYIQLLQFSCTEKYRNYVLLKHSKTEIML